MRIPLGSDGNGSVDLRDVVAAVGPQDHLTWVLRGARVIGDLRRVDGASTLQERSWLDQGAELDWSAVQQIATDCDQVVDGYFTGYDEAGRSSSSPPSTAAGGRSGLATPGRWPASVRRSPSPRRTTRTRIPHRSRTGRDDRSRAALPCTAPARQTRGMTHPHPRRIRRP